MIDFGRKKKQTTNNKQKNMNKYLIGKTESIAVSAETPSEALQKVNAGEGIVMALHFTVSPRPDKVPKGVVFSQGEIASAAATAAEESPKKGK